MRCGVIVFPGSNCDDDMIYLLGKVMGWPVSKIWHKERQLPDLDLVVLPGGFAFGDYLRCGAVARFSPIMEEVIRFAGKGGLVWGICNGFQVLCEAGLLPGVLLRNRDQRFICKQVYLKVENTSSPLTMGLETGKVLQIPIAHAEGRYYAHADTLKELEDAGQVLFRYCTESGAITDSANINGSEHAIAGICNKQGNVFALMPHPERAAEPTLGNSDGLTLFHCLAQSQSVLS